MKDKRWAKISVCGVLGGPLALFFRIGVIGGRDCASRDGAMVVWRTLLGRSLFNYFSGYVEKCASL